MSSNRTDRILWDLMRANCSMGGLKAQELFRLDRDFFKRVQNDVQKLVEDSIPSEVAKEGHVTNWTQPIGRAVQYSLLNRTGNFDDTSFDHMPTLEGKAFHHHDRYPALGAFVAAFPHAFNMRLNGMETHSGLSKHKEDLCVYHDKNSFMLRARFHLPIKTNEKVEMYLDGDNFHFDEGRIYLFNNGCVHSAMNGGATVRYHLVWDMLLTRETMELMFGESPLSVNWMKHTPLAERDLKPLRSAPVGEYEVFKLPPVVERLKLTSLGLKPYQATNIFSRVNFLRMRATKAPRFVDLGLNYGGVDL